MLLELLLAESLKLNPETSSKRLVLRADNEHATYLLSGEVAQLKTGERVRLSGKRNRKEHSFTVNRLSKDFGACPATAATPKDFPITPQ
jgi:hypothetical protein